MRTTTYKLKIIMLTPMLGSQSTREVATEFIAKKNGFEYGQDELEMLPDALERGTTVFHRDAQGRPVMRNYQILGFLKASAQVQNGKVAGGVKALRSKVGNQVFISPIVLPIKFDGDVDYLERPLRAETAQGPRVALARSEQIPEGAVIECGLEVMDGELSEEVLRDLLDYGYYRGLGQWRNSGAYGTFRYELVKEV